MREFRVMKLGGGGTYLTVHANHYFSTPESFVFVGPDMIETVRYPRAEFSEVIVVNRPDGERRPGEI